MRDVQTEFALSLDLDNMDDPLRKNVPSRSQTSCGTPTLLQELKWTPDGWPYFENSRPKLTERRFVLP